MPALEAIERCERRGTLIVGTLVYGSEVKSVATYSQLGLERRDRNQRSTVTPPFGQLPNPSQLHRTFIGLQLCVPTLHRKLADQYLGRIIAPVAKPGMGVSQ
jgi:hypothetical protein